MNTEPTSDNSTVLGSIQGETTSTEPQIPTPAEPAGSFTDLLNGSDFVANWTDKLPGELKEYAKTLSKFKSPTQLMTSYASLEKEFSKRSNEGGKLPGPDATDEDWALYAQKIGAPSKDEYKVSKPEGTPDALFNQDLVDKTLNIAAKYGLPQKAVDDLVGAYSENITQMYNEEVQQETQAVEQVMNTLKQEYGAGLSTQIQKAQRAATAIGLDVNNPAIGNNLDIIKALIRVDSLLSEDNLNIPGASTASTYEETYKKILNSPEYQGKHGPKAQMEAGAKLKMVWEAMSK